jgi:hypothetical protein
VQLLVEIELPRLGWGPARHSPEGRTPALIPCTTQRALSRENTNTVAIAPGQLLPSSYIASSAGATRIGSGSAARSGDADADVSPAGRTCARILPSAGRASKAMSSAPSPSASARERETVLARAQPVRHTLHAPRVPLRGCRGARRKRARSGGERENHGPVAVAVVRRRREELDRVERVQVAAREGREELAERVHAQALGGARVRARG